jgi:integrase
MHHVALQVFLLDRHQTWEVSLRDLLECGVREGDARKIDAERFIASTEAGKMRGDWTDPALGKMRLGEWSERWLTSVRPTLKPKTAESYASLLRSRILPDLGSFSLGALRPSDVARWIGTMQEDGLSASRIRQAHVVLGQLLDAAMLDGRLARNPADGARLPRLVRQEAAFLSPAIVDAIATEIREPYGLLVRLLGTVGSRFGEAAALRRRSVDLVGRRLVISESLAEVGGHQTFGSTKTHSTRRVPLPRSLASDLDEHLDHLPGGPDALVFTSPQGTPLRHSTFRQRCWLPALQRAGVPPVGIHVLRHSAAAAMIHAGATPKELQVVLGHASAGFSLTQYGHIFDADLDRVADRLDALLDPGTGQGRDKAGGTLVPIDAAHR